MAPICAFVLSREVYVYADEKGRERERGRGEEGEKEREFVSGPFRETRVPIFTDGNGFVSFHVFSIPRNRTLDGF